MLIYKNIEKLDISVIVCMLKSKNKDDVINGLLSLTLYGDDWKIAQDTCLSLLEHEDIDVVKAAVIGIGHTARVHGKIGQSAITALNSKMNDEDLYGTIEDVFDDIDIYVKNSPILDELSI